MAEQMLARIGDEIKQQWPKVEVVSILHRTGRLEIGEPSVLIAVATPHRGDGCFEGLPLRHRAAQGSRADLEAGELDRRQRLDQGARSSRSCRQGLTVSVHNLYSQRLNNRSIAVQYRHLGRSGLQVSTIGLGTNQFGGKVDQAGVSQIVETAIDLGINLIDTADVYQQGRSESTLGLALKGKWHKVVLATKGFNATGDGPNDKGASRYHLITAVEDSLRRLQSDHIDLYQMHRWDADTPIEETLRALDDLVRSGKVRYIGASNYMAWQLARANLLAEWNHWTPFVSIQNHYHMFERELERELLRVLCCPSCRHSAVFPAGRRLSDRQIPARRPSCQPDRAARQVRTYRRI